MPEKMNPEIKADWVQALRSGQYKQGVGGLQTTVGGERRNCCLGVLTDRAVLAGVVEPWVAPTGLQSPFDRVDDESAILPEAVRVWAGLGDHNPDVIAGKQSEDGWYEAHASLAELNDGGLTFAEIADLIEEQL